LGDKKRLTSESNLKNPFFEFKGYKVKRKKIPLDEIIKYRELILDKIVKGYEKLMDEEIKSLVWLVEHSRIIKVYEEASKWIKDIDYKVEDIEEFCYELTNSERIPYFVPGPSGIYISALCNQAKEREITLKLNDLERPIHMLGYRLPKGKKLIIEGEMGDFMGVGMEGGELIIEGSARNWTGAGMRDGKILVKKNVGYHTGEWMRGGEIWVEGGIRGLGKMIAGKIFDRGKDVIPFSTQR